MELPDNILVVGLGSTGVAVARYLAGLGKRVVVTDQKGVDELGYAIEGLAGLRYEARLGGHRREDFLASELIIVSPGVDSELPVLREAREAGIRVTGEIEFASSLIEEPVIAITGTNGKTTATTLLGEIFSEAFGGVFVGGNIGRPLMDYVLEGKRASHLILEISSFQLETIERFRPRTAILLNVTEDHLDRYRDFGDYVAAKWRIFGNQGPDDVAVLNRHMPLWREIRSRKLFFSSQEPLPEGAFFSDGKMVVRLDGREYVYRRELSPLVGVHNTENVLAVLLTAHLYGIERDLTEGVLARFRGLPHRIEFLREAGGVKFYNDSKATNVDSTKRALEGFASPVVLIAGGKDKGGSYGPILDLADRIKALVLIGEASDRIERELGGTLPVFREKTLGGAVGRAKALSTRGDVVLFSPMCSSFDMFRDYKDRGDQFRTAVEAL